jgi:hypothetical protein
MLLPLQVVAPVVEIRVSEVEARIFAVNIAADQTGNHIINKRYLLAVSAAI